MSNSLVRRVALVLILGLACLAGSATISQAQVMYSYPHYSAWTVDPMPQVYRDHWKARPAWYGSEPRARSSVFPQSSVVYPERSFGGSVWPVSRGPWVPRHWLSR